MMRFKLNTEAVNNIFFKNGKVKHTTGIKIKLLPFPANSTKLKEVSEDLKDFKGIAGTCFRECLKLSHGNLFDKHAFISAVCLKANAPGNPNLINLIEKVAFNDLGQLVLFDPLIYPYIRNVSGGENPTLNNIGKFIVSIFFDQKDQEDLQLLTKKDPDNLFYKLIIACIPNPEKVVESQEKYYQFSELNRMQFKQDLQTMLKDQSFFISNFHQLLKFYFFKYVVELSIELNALFGERKDQLFFSVKWEKLQSHRTPIINGWELFQRHIKTLFTHAVTLELINYIDGFEVMQVTYKEVIKSLSKMTSEDKINLISSLEELNETYRSGVADVNWQDLDFDLSKAAGDPVLEQIIKLFQSIDFQFEKSSRGRAKDAFKEWMSEFTRLNFSKRRGQLGHSLNLDHEFILLITRLCVGDAEKIRLNSLWEEFEKRGVFLDNLSRENIINYFDKINLLEKKSDSGDAQYVRKFSQILV